METDLNIIPMLICCVVLLFIGFVLGYVKCCEEGKSLRSTQTELKLCKKKEVIQKLEAVKPKTCEGCTYFYPSHQYWCKCALECSRKFEDKFYQKEKQC